MQRMCFLSGPQLELVCLLCWLLFLFFCFFSPGRSSSWQVCRAGSSSRHSGISAHSTSTFSSRIFLKTTCNAGCRHLWTPGFYSMAPIGLGPDRLWDRVEEPRVATDDEPRRDEARIQGDGRQPADTQPDSRAAAAYATPQDEVGYCQGGGCVDEPNALRRRLRLRLRHDGSTESAGQRSKPAGGRDQNRGTLGRCPHCRESSTGPLALPM